MSGVTLNGRFLTRPLTGVDRYAVELLRAWLPTASAGAAEGRGARGVRTLLPARATPKELHGLPLQVENVGSFQGHAWEQFELPRHAGDDTLLNLCNTGPVTRRRQLVVLHDAGVIAQPTTYSFAFRSWYRWLFSGLMRRAGTVATVSNFSAGELMKLIGRRAAGVEVIRGAGEHVLRTPADTRVLSRLGIEGQRYVLAVGSRTPNKNLRGVLEASTRLRDLGYKLVAAGGSNSRVFSGVTLDDESLVLAGYVTDAELRALYENAACFVFPSFYEGFGLPPVEAMHCGCPVIVSKRASLPEVCGGAAVYCDPEDPADIAAQLRRVLTSASLRAELREAGLIRAREFSWSKAAGELTDLLNGNGLRAAA
jgi:glycosyltransferase involved in cell wall biosynthesis